MDSISSAQPSPESVTATQVRHKQVCTPDEVFGGCDFRGGQHRSHLAA